MLALMPHPKPRVKRGPMPFTARLVVPEPDTGRRRRSLPFGYHSRQVAEARMYALLRRDGIPEGAYVVIARVTYEKKRGVAGEPRYIVVDRQKVLTLKREGTGSTAHITRHLPEDKRRHASPYAD